MKRPGRAKEIPMFMLCMLTIGLVVIASLAGKPSSIGGERK